MPNYTILSVTSKSVVGETLEGEHQVFLLDNYPNLKAAKKGDIITLDNVGAASLESKAVTTAKAPSAGRGSKSHTSNLNLM